jgi:arginyl-tRNA synthetase
LTCSKLLGKNPREVAEEIKAEFEKSANEVFERVEIAGPGFINFFLKSNYLENLLSEIEQKGQMFGRVNKKTTHKVMVEFGDPNPFKEIHIGHLRNFCIGESYSRLLESQGKEVIRTNYQGDVGLHVAKCLWGIQRLKIKDERLKIEIGDLSKGYVLGAKKSEEDEEAKKEIQELNKKIYEVVLGEANDESLKNLWEEGRKVSLEHFEALYKRIGVNYDKYYYESVTAKKGKEIVESHIEDGIFEKSDGAVVFRGEKEGLHTRVFLTSQNYATYEGKDLALAILKNEDENADESVILTGNEQLEYFQVMLKALSKIAPAVAQKTKHFTFGHVRLKEGKMSSRTGDVIAASWLLDEAVSQVLKAFPEMDKNTAEKVGVGAVKYSMLKFSIPSDIHFSFEESISLEGNSGPYLQYTYVRTRSVLEKSLAGPDSLPSHSTSSPEAAGAQWDTLSAHHPLSLEKEEQELLRFLAQFPYILAQAADEFAPNLLCNYLFELSQKFNLFYQKHKIIGSENEEFRLKLTQSVGQVLQSGLGILGIETVEKM